MDLCDADWCFRSGELGTYDKVNKRENYVVVERNVENAIDVAKEWCKKNRNPYKNEVVVTNIYSEEF